MFCGDSVFADYAKEAVLVAVLTLHIALAARKVTHPRLLKLYVDAFGKISHNVDRILELVKEQSN